MTTIARHWIGSKWVSKGPKGETVDAYLGKPSGAYCVADRALTDQAIEVARAAFEGTAWAHQPRLRAKVLLELADAIDARKQEIAHQITVENGKVLAHSMHETAAAISEARYYAGIARSIFGRVTDIDDGKQSIFAREPIGVASIIVPWNAPSTLLLRSLGPALAAGCTAVIKGAHQTAGVNRIYAECLASCPSLPPGVVNVVHGELEVSQTLCTHPDIDVVSFTGSSTTGKQIMAGAAPTLKRLSLELGGKAPALIFADADMALAVREITNGMIAHCGQMCTAIARILVADEAWNSFIPALVETLKSVTVGNPMDSSVQMGPLLNEASGDRYSKDVGLARDAGETLLDGRIEAGHPRSNVVSPALYLLEKPQMRLTREELFSPIGIVERFADEEDAVRSANATRYGLAASVHTNDHGRARRVARAMKAGTVWINCHNRLFAEAETGGYRESGLGRLHGLEGLADFMETKHIYAEFGRLEAG